MGTRLRILFLFLSFFLFNACSASDSQTLDGGQEPIADADGSDFNESQEIEEDIQENIDQQRPQISGSYRLTTFADLQSQATSQINDAIDSITSFYANPTDSIMLAYCLLPGTTDLCDYVFENPDVPSVDELTSIGMILAGMIESRLETKEIYANHSAAEIEDALNNLLLQFELESSLTITNEPDDLGVITRQDGLHVLGPGYYYWKLDVNCQPDQPDCGRYSFNLSDINGVESNDLSTSFSANYAASSIEIDSHHFNLAYNKLLGFLLENIAVGKLSPNPEDASFEDFMMRLLGGDQCPDVAACCSAYADQLSSEAQFIRDLLESSCMAMVIWYGGALREKISALQPAAEPSLELGSESACPVLDSDTDQKIDLFGSEQAGCQWQINFGCSLGNYQIVRDFWGTRSE
jgi:hypothetical protein